MSKTNIKLYVAHSLQKRKYVRKMQLKLEEKFNVILLNPFYSVKRNEIEILDKLRTRKERDEYAKSFTMEMCNRIVNIDLEMIRKSDGLLAVVNNKKMCGTFMEIMYAHMLGLNIYIITQDFKYHPWIRSFATAIFGNVTEFKWFLKEKGYERK